MTPVDESVAPANRRSRNVLVTFIGAFVRSFDNWMPIAGTIDLTGQLGLDSASVRTAISRLKKRGWLEAENRAGVRGYRLTEHALEEFAEGDEVIWHAREPARLEDGWCVVTFSIPESARTKRHFLRRHLTALGFGNVSAAVWIAPARMQAAAGKAIAELGLAEHCAVFVGDYAGGQDLRALLVDAWDLDELQRSYQSFLDDHAAGERERRPEEMDGREAFVTYLGILDRWRKLPYRDPGLPREVLPAGWNGPDATARFERLVEALEAPALAHAARYWPAT
ncbi:PaaX family transcriptional regulator [Marmoricola sp. RAF53]|uniref:PaaX family transcriptional regulator n=1 Tax=Marmoricola sp. RAF53 TaxID=3233059 RepID=UPI003F9609E8